MTLTKHLKVDYQRGCRNLYFSSFPFPLEDFATVWGNPIVRASHSVRYEKGLSPRGSWVYQSSVFASRACIKWGKGSESREEMLTLVGTLQCDTTLMDVVSSFTMWAKTNGTLPFLTSLWSQACVQRHIARGIYSAWDLKHMQGKHLIPELSLQLTCYLPLPLFNFLDALQIIMLN